MVTTAINCLSGLFTYSDEEAELSDFDSNLLKKIMKNHYKKIIRTLTLGCLNSQEITQAVIDTLHIMFK